MREGIMTEEDFIITSVTIESFSAESWRVENKTNGHTLAYIRWLPQLNKWVLDLFTGTKLTCWSQSVLEEVTSFMSNPAKPGWGTK
jgi:hypothetical protein